MRYTSRQYATRLFFFLANPLRHAYWFVCRPTTRGAKCLIEYEGKFLFVRLNYAHYGWSIPGGGVKKQETFEQAAKREALEEVGLVVDEVVFLGEYLNTHQYKIDTVQVFHCRAKSAYFKVDNFEIAEAAWLTPDKLPSNHSPSVRRILRMHREKTTPANA